MKCELRCSEDALAFSEHVQVLLLNRVYSSRLVSVSISDINATQKEKYNFFFEE